jgi:hypothetical protein
MDGVLLGVAMGKSKTGPVEESDTDPQPGEYHGGKWGVHVRAPDLWFDFLTRFDDRLAPLAQIADVQRGITTGKDSFFYPKDASLERIANRVVLCKYVVHEYLLEGSQNQGAGHGGSGNPEKGCRGDLLHLPYDAKTLVEDEKGRQGPLTRHLHGKKTAHPRNPPREEGFMVPTPRKR